MGSKKKIYEIEGSKSRSEIAAIFRRIADGLTQGTLSLEGADQETPVKVPDSATIAIELEEKDKGSKGLKKSLEIELEWYEQEAAGADAAEVAGESGEKVDGAPPTVEEIWKAIYGGDEPEVVICSLGHEHALRDLKPVPVDQQEKCYESPHGLEPQFWGLECPECSLRTPEGFAVPGNA